MYCLLECVHGLCKKGPVSYHVPAVNDEAKGICQLYWYGTQVLLQKEKKKLNCQNDRKVAIFQLL